MPLENFLTNEVQIGISLITISSILLLVSELTKQREFDKLKDILLISFWSSIIFLIGSIFYKGHESDFIINALIFFGGALFLISLILFGIFLTPIVLKKQLGISH